MRPRTVHTRCPHCRYAGQQPAQTWSGLPRPPSTEQRKVQPAVHRLRPERCRQPRIALQLAAIALLLLVEKALAIRALMHACLVVDHPAHTSGDKGAVDGHVHELAVHHTGELQFVGRLCMRLQHPLPAFIAQSAHDGLQHTRGGGLGAGRRHAQ
jgi:hypothetical protein